MPKPTQRDAQLLLQVMSLTSDEESRRANRWFWEEFDIKSYRKFKKKYPPGSDGDRYFNRLMTNWETLATLVVNGLINEDLAFDMVLVKPHWERAEPIVHGRREDWKSPRLYENFEVLAQKEVRWEKRHPPKVKAARKKK